MGLDGQGKNPHGVTEGINAKTLRRWIDAGFLDLPLPGTGHPRPVPPEEVRAIRAVDSVRRLGGATPNSESFAGTRTLMRSAAAAARVHQPGDVVEMFSPVPWVRLVLVVPEVT